MTTQLHDTGEEYYQDKLSGESFAIGLFNDASDALTDANDLTDIATEPSDGNYVRQSGEIFSSSASGGDWVLTNDSQVVFDVTNTTGTVDSYFIVVNYQSDGAGDGAPTDHLLASGSLSQSYDLSNLDTLTLSADGIGTSLT